MTDPIERLQRMRDELNELLEAEAAKHEKLEADLVLAMAYDALSRALPYIRHEGPRAQVTGARDQVKRLMQTKRAA
jgi:hypothetical protein